MIDKAYVISYLCNITSEVGKRVFHNELTQDCFCRESHIPDSEFRMDREILDFISDAVNEKIAKEISHE